MKHDFTLRQLREHWQLSQTELAQLLGVQQTSISGYENGGHPSLSVVLAYRVVFGKRLASLFAALYTEIEDQVINRAVALERQVRDKTDDVSVRKRELLSAIMARATSRAGL